MRIFVLLPLVALLAACPGGGGSGGGNTPTDPSLDFSLFPSGYFGGSYTASYSLSGSFSNGHGATATYNVHSGSTTTFNSQPVITIGDQATITDTTTNGVASGTSETYFSTDTSNPTVVGNYSPTSGVSYYATSTTVIPLTAKIGNFGNIGTYTGSDGTTYTSSWALQDGYNGNAKLAITFAYKDSSNNPDATEIDTYTIKQDGTRVHLDVNITFYSSGGTLTLSGS
jgi:hypothetical protein